VSRIDSYLSELLGTDNAVEQSEDGNNPAPSQFDMMKDVDLYNHGATFVSDTLEEVDIDSTSFWETYLTEIEDQVRSCTTLEFIKRYVGKGKHFDILRDDDDADTLIALIGVSISVGLLLRHMVDESLILRDVNAVKTVSCSLMHPIVDEWLDKHPDLSIWDTALSKRIYGRIALISAMLNSKNTLPGYTAYLKEGHDGKITVMLMCISAMAIAVAELAEERLNDATDGDFV
jgi:hypothetical protein